MYQTNLKIKDALDDISSNLYVLPAIQREFVWRPEQICRLFDSLMQGYPFGTFLFWKVQPERSAEFKFYGFIQNYHERDNSHCPDLGTLPNRELTAVLDGQQRLTALNIGLRGSLAIKEPNKWRNNPNAFIRKTLHLDLFSDAIDEEDGEAFRFRFLEPEAAAKDATTLWFPLHRVLTSEYHELSSWLNEVMTARGLNTNVTLFTAANKKLYQLHNVVHNAPVLTYYPEKSQNLDRVLRIFIRMNSGGTVLSYSDLLLSIAVAQWGKLDARYEIHSLVDEINDVGLGFNYSKDFVLKAGLMLADIAAVGFKVENFNAANMRVLESKWPEVRRALVMTAHLAASFGLDQQTLRADSSLLPIAYYIYSRKLPEAWLTQQKSATDRQNIRHWLVRSLVKASGIWGSGLDVLLTHLRDVIRESTGAFPHEALEQAMAGRGKPLTFGDEEIDDLLDMEYGDRRLFPLLSLLFPFIDVSQHHHIDHVYPRALLQKRKLEKAGATPADITKTLDVRDKLANLQLLQSALNAAKNDSLPADWLAKVCPDQDARAAFITRCHLGTLPTNPLEFLSFYEARRQKLKTRLEDLLTRKA